jgi:iron complex transport system substrate-binding protein
LPIKVVFIIQPGPLVVAGPGTVINDALTLLGLQNIAADAGVQYPKYSIEEVVRRAPDVVFFGQGSMSGNVPKALLQRLSSLDAVKKGHVYYTSEML